MVLIRCNVSILPLRAHTVVTGRVCSEYLLDMRDARACVDHVFVFLLFAPTRFSALKMLSGVIPSLSEQYRVS